MRITYICIAPIPSSRAAAVHIMKMCDAFVRNGHDVTLEAPDWPDCRAEVDATHSFYGTSGRFEIARQPYPRFRGRSLVYAMKCAIDAKKRKADLAYGRHIISVTAAGLLGIPTVFESHWPIDQMAGIERLCFGIWRRLSNSRRLVVISKVLANLFVEAGFDPRRIKVAPDAADVHLFDAGRAEECDARRAGLRVGFAGSLGLGMGRGEHIILDLAREFPDCKFKIAGGDPDDVSRLQALYDGSNLELSGHIPPADIPDFLLSCDILLAPYQKNVGTAEGRLTGRWTSPLKVFEYMATGRPMVVSDLPVIREVVSDEEAVLVAPGELRAWVAAIESLRDPERRRMLGQNARIKVEANYTWDRRAAQALDGIPDLARPCPAIA